MRNRASKAYDCFESGDSPFWSPATVQSRPFFSVFERATWLILAMLLVIIAIVGLSPSRAHAQATQFQADPDDFVEVRMREGDSLRSLANEYLSNPDLWPIILELNGLNDITEVAPDQELRLPANQVKVSSLALQVSLSEIQKANDAGAQLFAPLLVRNAIRFRDDALVQNNKGAYTESISLSTRSIASSGSAVKKSQEMRDIEAEARLSDRQGWVEGQKADEFGWSERDLNSILNEQEKLRTLSRSTAQVVFRDASRLRLNPNSQAVIQRMRADPLNRSDEAQISLVEGNFYALLSSDNKRSKLQVNLENVDAKIDSGSFWVSQEEDGAKFSNYDTQPVEISAGDETLVLGQNEGAFIRDGEVPGGKVNVLSRIGLLEPEDEAIVYGSPPLAWEASNSENGYWLEVAFDPRFDKMADSKFGIPETRVDDVEVAPGIYYWRVAALDDFGLPGQMSTVRKFEMRDDTVPPFLQLRTPQPDAILREAAVTISGETEPGAAVIVNGELADVDAEGRFFLSIQSIVGRNEVVVVAQDVAGNKSEKPLAFTYLPDAQSEIIYDAGLPRDEAGRFLAAGSMLTVSARANPEAKIAVIDETGVIRSETYSGADGGFVLNIPLKDAEEEFTVKVTAASGYSYEEKLGTLFSNEPPKIRLAEPLPRVTADPALRVIAQIEPGVTLSLNGSEPQLSDEGAVFEAELVEGPNLIEIIATNQAGLVSIDKRTVIYDAVEPEVARSELTVEAGGTSQFVNLRVAATDNAGLAKTSRYTLRIGDFTQNGVLRFNRATKSYSGSMEVPLFDDDQEMVAIVELSDIAGNIRKLELTR